jgi:molybdate transport system substrate-binding protein
MKRSLRLLFALCATGLVLTACGGSGSGNSSSNSNAPVALDIFAAASLTEAFTTIKTNYEEANPKVILTFNFAGSNTLSQQILAGAPADVFASADTQNMDKVQKQSLVNDPQTFAKNKLEVIVPKANPANITTLKDLANKGVKIAVADASVPVGQYTLEVLNKMAKSSEYGPAYESAVKANFVTQETSVKGVLQKVQLGEVDAGYVYVSDAYSAKDDVKGITIPDQFNVIAEYPIATLKSSSNQSAADAFIKYVLSPAGQAVLKDYDFIPVS